MKRKNLKKELKKFITALKKIWKKNKDDIVIGIITLFVLILGSFVIGFAKTILIVLLLYIILYRKKIINYIKFKYIKYKGINSAKDDIVKKVKKMEKNH